MPVNHGRIGWGLAKPRFENEHARDLISIRYTVVEPQAHSCDLSV